MRRYHVYRAVRAARLSALEEGAFLAGLIMTVGAVVAAVLAGDLGGLARMIGCAGLAGLAICAASRAVRLYRAGVTASLPNSVGRVRVRTRAPRVLSAITVLLALVLPLAGSAALLVGVEWAWLALAAVWMVGGAGAFATWMRQARVESRDARRSSEAAAILERLCIRADMRVPELVIEHGAVANAWTVGGRVHVTSSLLELLDCAEVEAVLAHELAHLAHRDAAVMDICAAPGRVLLAFAGVLAPRLRRWAGGFMDWGLQLPTFLVGAVALFCLPPTFAIGWVSRLSVLGMSRRRELVADVAAAALTGRPSALASALLKLERQREWAPRSDLRQAEAYAVLCIVGTQRTGVGRLFATHPPTAARVKRLEEMEARIQSGSRSRP